MAVLILLEFGMEDVPPCGNISQKKIGYFCVAVNEFSRIPSICHATISCEECLENEQKQSQIFCINCEQQAVVPVGGVKELDNAFFVNHLINKFITEHKEKGDIEVKCNGCSRGDPTEAFCLYCSLNMCSTCSSNHKSNPKTAGHSIVPLVRLRDISKQPKPRTLTCEVHDSELLYYCESCDQFICVWCTEKDHDGHDYDTVEKKADKYRQELTKMATAVDEMSKSLSEAFNNIDKVEELLKKQSKEVHRKIDQYYDSLVQQLLEQKEKVKRRVGETASQKEMVLKEMLYTQKEAASMKELYSAVEKGCNEEMLSVKKHVNHETEQLNDKCSSHNFGHFIIDANVCTSKATDLPPYAVVEQKVEFTIITNECDGRHCSGGGKHIQLLHYATGAFINAEIKDNNDGSYLVSFVPVSHGEVKFLVSVNGKQASRTPYSIAVRRYSSIIKPSVIVEGDDDDNCRMESPWGIAWSRKGNSGDDEGQFQSPQGVVFDEDNNLYVADGGNFRVQKFDSDGNYLLQFSSQGSDPGQFDSTWGITAHNGKVYVADEHRQCVSVFTTTGQFCSTIGLGTLDAPHDVTINHDNHLLTADFNQNCVYTSTLDGKCIGKVGTKGSEQGQLSGPYSVTTDIYGSILVTDTYNHRISIFDKDGNFVHCFGSYGWGHHSNFHLPNGIAISPNGSINVSDHENKRVQIFSL
ncbi:tripartite motif-containing protein 2-like [Dysidea avara]|uniref:tripartite motif-containing protein 2-like n=1 Tax=Dysidea avara TaxID=196820 RepID=UPI00332FECED